MKPESLRKDLRIALIALLSGALGYTLRELAGNAIPPFLQYVLPTISKITLLWLCLTLFLGCVLLGTWVCFLVFGDEKSKLMKKYKQVDGRGFYKGKKDGTHVCGVCLLIRSIESPIYLRQVVAGFWQWQCQNPDCKTVYQPLIEELVKTPDAAKKTG
jgi:hypothetical protein